MPPRREKQCPSERLRHMHLRRTVAFSPTPSRVSKHLERLACGSPKPTSARSEFLSAGGAEPEAGHLCFDAAGVGQSLDDASHVLAFASSR
jgi:hypothetical protein